MRKWVLFAASALVVGAILFQMLTARQGFVLVSIGSYVIETSLWGLLVIALLLWLVVWLLVRCWRFLMVPRRWVSGRAHRREQRNINRTLQGFLDFIEGNWPRAIVNLKKSAQQSELPAVNYLGAAAASFNLGNNQDAVDYLKSAELSGIADDVTARLMRVRLLLQEGKFAEALPLVQDLYRRQPSHPSVLRLLASTLKGMRDWRALETLLPDLGKYNALSEQEIGQLSEEVYRELLVIFPEGLAPNLSQSELQNALDRLWEEIPKALQREPRLVAQYVRKLVVVGRADKAETRLRRFLNKHWHPELVRLYGSLEVDPSRQLGFAEGWLKAHGGDADLLSTLGHLSVASELWGKARRYFEEALAISPTPATYYALGSLLTRRGDEAASFRCFQQGLNQALSGVQSN